MAIIDIEHKSVKFNIVYYGPGRSGKTATLKYLYDRYEQHVNSDLTQVSVEGDNAFSFDYLPLYIGRQKGHQVSIQFYSMPGQFEYSAVHKFLLKGTDGIVFTADSMIACRKKNIRSLKKLEEYLMPLKKSFQTLPLVFQYNKRDLSQQGIPLLTVKTLHDDLNKGLKVPAFETSAVTGKNIITTMKKIVALTLDGFLGDQTRKSITAKGT